MFSEIDKKILKILLDEKKPISSRSLALRCNVAINTIRKEISLINEETENYGFRIESKTATGHYLDIFDRQLAEPYLQKIQYLYKRNRYFLSQYSENVAYLLRKCLCASGYVTVEEICEELYCSRSTVLRYLNDVKSVLEKYELRMVNRRGYGLCIEGNEWNIRQCLLYQHKVYNLEVRSKERKEYAFKSMFFMMDGINRYEQIWQVFFRCLKEQHEFLLSFMHVPKIVNFIFLIASRSKQASGYSFTQEQIDRVKDTAEYEFVKRLQAELPERFQKGFHENDFLALAMLLLSFETQNSNLKDLEEYQCYYEETQELITCLSEEWDYPREKFDDVFVEDCICFLHTLDNRYFFHVYNDTEMLEFVRYKGIRTADMCVSFARFYERKHGIRLNRQDTLSAFYMLHRIVRLDDYCYCAQRILVISRYGLQYGRALAAIIRQSYGIEVQTVDGREFCDVRDDDFLDYDLLVTDMNSKQISKFVSYTIPTIQVDYPLGRPSCPELDTYLNQLHIGDEVRCLERGGFHRATLKNKREVFECLAELFEKDGIDREKLICHMGENDAYIDLERENGVVFLPVMMEEIKEAQIRVLLSKTAFTWNENHSQIFVCYSRVPCMRDNQIISNILKRFVRISAENVEKLVYHSGVDPFRVLYPEMTD